MTASPSARTAPGWAQVIIGPIRLPLDHDGQVHMFQLHYFEVGQERWVCAQLGQISGTERVPLRIESACFFGHVFGSRQCDCGFQLDEAFRHIARDGRGLVIYGVDQDARGLGLAAHFRIYDYRQREGLDTPEVFARLGAPLDNRSYAAVPHILRHVEAGPILLLSNNPARLAFLREAGIDVVRAPHEAALDPFNMATLMLEKEDLGYQWTFRTHGDWLRPLQAEVEGDTDRRAAALVHANETCIARWSGSDWNVAAGLLAQAPTGLAPVIAYLSDLPRQTNWTLCALRHSGRGGSLRRSARPADPPRRQPRAEAAGLGGENRYGAPRPQWLPDGTGLYARGGEKRAAPAPVAG